FTSVPGADLQSLIGGYQFGYNVQLGSNVIVGAEADVSFGNLNGIPHQGGPQYISTFERFGTVRLRAGQAFGPLLPYVTGGVAWGRNKLLMGDPAGDERHVIRAHWGWTVGFGV